jgi:pilus assembly protein Flp/PilA
MKQLLKRLWQEEDGQDLTEYALLVVLIALAAVGAMKGLAGAINAAFGSIASGLSTAAPS